MFESLVNIESLIAVSVGAIFSFKISKANVNIRSERREQSQNVSGDNNVIVYNNNMLNVRKEMRFSVKACAFAIFLFFHMFSGFFIQLLSSLSIFLPLFCLFGVINNIRLYGFSRGGDFLYLLFAIPLGVVCYCAAQLISQHADLYPRLFQLFSDVSSYGIKSVFYANTQIISIAFIILSSIACSGLILLHFYLSFAFVIYRNANDAFRYSLSILVFGYALYFLSSGAVFSPFASDLEYFKAVLVYPFKILSF